MKSIQRIAAAVAVLVMIIAAQRLHAQVAGGWSSVSTSDAGIVAATRFALEEVGQWRAPVKLKKIIHARQQVVAGMNYEVTLLVKQGKGSRKAVAVVWHKTDGSYALTSWTWTGKKN
ncbi:MAG: cystatin domain-containing protein [Candidatus Kapaibacterium sp.]